LAAPLALGAPPDVAPGAGTTGPTSSSAARVEITVTGGMRAL